MPPRKIFSLFSALVIWALLFNAVIPVAFAAQPHQPTLALDGLRDASYTLLAQDPSGDLANPGPGGWAGTTWTDLTDLYVYDDGSNLWVYVALPNYAKTISSGEIGLVMDVTGDQPNSGGTVDPWGRSITFAYNSTHNNVGETPQSPTNTILPDKIIRGNIPGISGNPPDDNNGWTELRTWNGNNWNTGASVNWGGITGGGQIGSRVAYANNQGVEFMIPWSDLGVTAGSTVHLQFFATQKSPSKGAFDTVPSDDQSTGWDDPTTQTHLATFGGAPLTPPQPPAFIHATDGSYADKVRISWSVSTGASSYQIYRADTPTGTKTLLGSSPTSPFDDTTALPGTTYSYWVKAVNQIGSSDFSISDTGYRNIGTPLSPPTNVQATDGTIANYVQISWNSVPGASNYNVYRSTNPQGPPILLNFSTASPFNDWNAAPGTIYYYWVTSVNANGESLFSLSDSGYLGSSPTNCSNSVPGDGQISTAEIFHDSTLSAYRDPLGNIEPTGSARLRLRACHNDLSGVQVMVWKTGDPLASPSYTYPAAVRSVADGYDYWEFDVPGNSIDQWYQFRITDGSSTGYYRVAGTNNSGPGVWSSSLIDRSWKLGTASGGGGGVSDYYVPDWMKDAIIYQIFPDRFRNGNTSNDTYNTNHTVYGPTTCNGGPCQPYQTAWLNPVIQDPNFGIEFKGGDLEGITQKINSGYFDDLGINVLYLNPIFESSSNHGYDTNDYYNVRNGFGGNAAFAALMTAANAHGIRVILDGVYNHVGSDSKYMDGYGYNRWPNDPPYGPGACEAANPYRSWFTTGGQGSGCSDGWGWKGWYNYETIPELVENDAVKNFFYRGGSPQSPGGVSVNQYWINQGTAGWRYDVAQDITLSWWADMRPYVKDPALGGDPDVLMLAEVTGGCASGLYQQYLTPNGVDSVMNYCFRDWVRGFANGDSPASFDNSLNGYRQSIPPSPFYAQMNLISSHDSPRLLSQLNDNKARLKLAVILQMTIPGAPSVYYGDEVGMSGTGDPSNRNAYPWADLGGSPDTALYNHFKTMITMRRDHSALRRGDMATLTTSGAYAFIRWDSNEIIVVALNNTESAANNVTIPVSSYLSDGAVLTDLLNGGTVTVSGGNLVVSIPAQWGKVLRIANPNPPPATPTGLQASDGTSGEFVQLTWNAVSGATGYQVYRASSPTGGKTQLGSPTTNSFNDTTATPGVTYYYWVKAVNNLSASDFSSPDSGWRSTPPPPAAPTGLQASDGSYPSHIFITWNPVSTATSYKLFRSTSPTGTPTLIATLTGLAYQDTDIVPNVLYYYWVKTISTYGESEFSPVDSGYAGTPAPPTAPTNVQASDGSYTDRVAVTWDIVAAASSYEVYRAQSLTGTKTLIGSPITNSFNDTTATPTVTYYYWVKAVNAQGSSDFSAPDTGYRAETLLPPAAPTNVQASDGSYTDRVAVTWDIVAAASSYEVYRAQSLTGTKTLIGSPITNSFNDTTATPAVTYYYWVKAVNAQGSSDFSAPDTGYRAAGPMPFHYLFLPAIQR